MFEDADGSLLIAQNDSSAVLKLTPEDKTTVAWANTRTGGALSVSAKGNTFIVERGLHQRIEQLTPVRKIHADMFGGEPLDCIGGVINDIVADGKGGVYFTMGGLFYADKSGNVGRVLASGRQVTAGFGTRDLDLALSCAADRADRLLQGRALSLCLALPTKGARHQDMSFAQGPYPFKAYACALIYVRCVEI